MRAVTLLGEQRLAAPGIETDYHLMYDNTMVNIEKNENRVGVWPQRLKARCRHFAENLHGKEIYEMWLRTSAGNLVNRNERQFNVNKPHAQKTTS